MSKPSNEKRMQDAYLAFADECKIQAEIYLACAMFDVKEMKKKKIYSPKKAKQVAAAIIQRNNPA